MLVELVILERRREVVLERAFLLVSVRPDRVRAVLGGVDAYLNTFTAIGTSRCPLDGAIVVTARYSARVEREDDVAEGGEDTRG